VTGELARAHGTLRGGASFFAGWLPPGVSVTHEHRSKVIANGLRELDRFLNILVDEVSLRHGLPVLPGRRNTANKLRDLRTALGLPHDDHERLLALGRSRDCLFHCGGTVARGDTPQARAMTLGWPEEAGRSLRRVPVGRPVVVMRADIESVCRFYRQMADDLILRVPILQ
jgi:hypothetical protein